MSASLVGSEMCIRDSLWPVRPSYTAAMFRARVVAVALCLPAAASAGNDEGIALSDDAALAGGAVVAMVCDGASLFYNPAGLACGTRDQIDVGATATLLRLYRLPGLLSTTAGAEANGSFTEFVSVPSALSYVRAIGADLRLGVGLFVPESFSSTLSVALTDPNGTFNLDVTSRQSIYVASAGLGWRAGPRLRLGASLSAVYVSVLANGVAWAGYGPEGSDQIFGLSQMFSVSAIGATANVGAQWEARPGLHIGFSLRAPTVLLLTAVSGAQVAGMATTDPPMTHLDTADLGSVELEVHQFRALRARLGVAWAWGQSWASLEADVQPAIHDDDVGVRRRAVWNVRGGAMLGIGPRTWVGFGAFTDRAPERAPDGVLDTRVNFFGGTVGLRMDHPHRLAAGEGPADVIFTTTFGVRYAYGSGDFGAFQFASPPGDDIVGGNDVISGHVHEFGLHIGSSVYF